MQCLLECLLKPSCKGSRKKNCFAGKISEKCFRSILPVVLLYASSYLWYYSLAIRKSWNCSKVLEGRLIVLGQHFEAVEASQCCQIYFTALLWYWVKRFTIVRTISKLIRLRSNQTRNAVQRECRSFTLLWINMVIFLEEVNYYSNNSVELFSFCCNNVILVAVL